MNADRDDPVAEPIPQPVPAPGDDSRSGRDAASVTTAIPPRCPTRTRAYRHGRLTEEGFAADQISVRLAEDLTTVVWLDLLDPDADDLQILVQEFGLHPLAVEDAVSPHQRPKIDRYPTHLFLNVYAVAVEAAAATVTSGELSTFITSRALITVRKGEFDIDALIARWDLNAELVDAVDDHHGNAVAVLAYGLLDAIVDGQFAAGDDLDDATEELERLLFAEQHGEDIRRRAYRLGAALAALRRVTAPMQDVIARLVRGDLHLVDDDLRPYFHDISDHAIRATETIDSARDRIARIVDTEINEQGARLNDVTKKLAAWAAIIAVPTAVTGFFGQNVPYPGAGEHAGYVVSSVTMIVLAVGLFVLLRRNRWL